MKSSHVYGGRMLWFLPMASENGRIPPSGSARKCVLSDQGRGRVVENGASKTQVYACVLHIV